MVKDGQIRAKHFSPSEPNFFFLPTTKAISAHGKLHERLCGDLYVAFETLGLEMKWERPTNYEENRQLGILPDRRMVLNESIVFWEVDRGTEDYVSDKGITGKIEKYLELANSSSSKQFSVVFTTIDAKQSAKARAKKFLDLFEFYAPSRADQFLVTLHKWAVEEPLNPVYLSPPNPHGILLLPAT